MPHLEVVLYFQVYEGLQYKLTFDFPSGYPYQAPTVRFDTPCYHPNVDKHGNICLDILKEKWSALYDVRTILLSLQSLLGGNDICTKGILVAKKSGWSLLVWDFSDIFAIHQLSNMHLWITILYHVYNIVCSSVKNHKS